MKTMLTHFDRLMAAITFAEANEPELAREFIPGNGKSNRNTQTPAGAKSTGGQDVTNKTAH